MAPLSRLATPMQRVRQSTSAQQVCDGVIQIYKLKQV